MLHKVAIAVAATLASAALFFALVLAGFVPSARNAAAAASATPAVDPALANQAPRVVLDTVYVAPAPPPQVIKVVKTAAAGGEPGETEGSGG